jgi:hypothetical protein
MLSVGVSMNTLTIEIPTELDSNQIAQIAIDRARMELLKDRLAKLVITIPASNKGSDMGRIATCGSNRIVLGGQH